MKRSTLIILAVSFFNTLLIAQTSNITFQVDMSNYAPAFTEVHVNGVWNNWCGNCNPLTDPDLDNIWTVTLPIPNGHNMFKFTVDGWTDQETFNPGDPCTVTHDDSFTDRIMYVDGDTTLPVFCWSSCSACGVVPAADTSWVNFAVDMNNYPPGFGTVAVAGSFNSWCGNCIPLADPDMDNIWTGNAYLPNAQHEFKFVLDDWVAQEALTPGDPCVTTMFGNTNRFLNVWQDTTYGVVCFDSCTTCGTPPPPPDTFNVTFQVDMSQYAGTFTTPEVNGTWNLWCGNCNPLADPDLDDIWTVTLPIPAGMHEFKYATDAWTDQEIFVGGEPCTVTNGPNTNRVLDLQSDTILSVVCWNSCDQFCPQPPDTFNVTFQVDMSQYGGTFTTPEVNGTWNLWCGNCNALADPDLDNIWTVTLPIVEGPHEYKYSTDSWTDQEMLLVGSPCTVTNGPNTNRFLDIQADTTLPVVCWNSCEACVPATPDTFSVTFQLDMSQYPGTFTSPEVNASWNSWCGNCEPLTDPDMDNIWTVTLQLEEGMQEFLFSVDSLTDQEMFPNGGFCTVINGLDTNRSVEILSDTILPVVCWNSCIACQPAIPDTFQVTFQVDMSQYGGTFTTPEVNGTWNAWCGSCNVMADPDLDEIWTVTLPIPQGLQEFKYSTDNWANQEMFAGGESCTVLNGSNVNRFVNIQSDTTLGVVCWNSCDTCLVIVTPDTFNVTFQVDMSQYGGTFTTPEVNGTWNAWCGNCNPMEDPDLDNVWTVTLPIAEGMHNFKYTTDNWNDQEIFTGGEACTVIDGGNNFNRFIDIQGDTTLGIVCWNSCDTCSSDTTELYNVTFQVDMQYFGGAFTTPEVNGTWNSWCGNCNPMADPDLDNIWTVTLPIPPGVHEFKYAVDNWTDQETLLVGAPCTVTDGPYTNRLVDIQADTVLGVVCWNSCVECDTVPPSPPDTFNVTFQVDMNQYGGPFSTPEVNATWNLWCGNCNAMADPDLDGIWTVTLPIVEGFHEYKYSVDSWNDQEVFSGGEPCIIGPNNNRFIDIQADTVLGVVCWNSCEACVPVQVDSFNVTLKVDMSEYAAAFTLPEVNASWNAWCGDCDPLSDPDLDGVWTTTVTVAEGMHEFLFSVDNRADEEVFSGGESCVVANGMDFYRSIEVSSDLDLDVVCWNSCDTCLGVSIDPIRGITDQFELFPNPSQGNFTLVLALSSGKEAQLSILDIQGKILFGQKIEGAKVDLSIEASFLKPGIYFVQVENEFGRSFRKLVLMK